MAAAQSVFTYGLIGIDSNQTIQANVLGANPTATTLVLSCPTGTDSTECGVSDITLTIGPWAQATPPPGASTGVYDAHATLAYTNSATTGVESFGVHCEIVSTTVPSICTTTDIGGDDGGNPTGTVTNPDPSVFGVTMMPVTITSGLDKLASLTSSGAASSTSGATSGSSARSTSGSGSATKTTGTTSATGTAASTSASASASHTNAASNVYGVNMGTVGLLGLLVAFFTR